MIWRMGVYIISHEWNIIKPSAIPCRLFNSQILLSKDPHLTPVKCIPLIQINYKCYYRYYCCFILQGGSQADNRLWYSKAINPGFSVLHFFTLKRTYSRLIQSSVLKKRNKIRSNQVLLIDENNTNLGTMATKLALEMAQAKGLELIQVSKGTRDEVPVCRLVSKKKLWEDSKRLKEQNKKDPTMIIKEIKISTGISEHDLETKIKIMRNLLKKLHPVKVWIQRKSKYSSTHDKQKQEDLLLAVENHIEDISTKTINKNWSSRGVLICTYKPG